MGEQKVEKFEDGLERLQGVTDERFRSAFNPLRNEKGEDGSEEVFEALGFLQMKFGFSGGKIFVLLGCVFNDGATNSLKHGVGRQDFFSGIGGLEGNDERRFSDAIGASFKFVLVFKEFSVTKLRNDQFVERSKENIFHLESVGDVKFSGVHRRFSIRARFLLLRQTSNPLVSITSRRGRIAHRHQRHKVRKKLGVILGHQ